MSGTMLTVPELAERLRCTTHGIYTMLHNNSAPPSVRIGKRRLFPEALLEQWIADRMATEAAAPVKRHATRTPAGAATA